MPSKSLIPVNKKHHLMQRKRCWLIKSAVSPLCNEGIGSVTVTVYWPHPLPSPVGTGASLDFRGNIPETQMPGRIEALGNAVNDLVHRSAMEVGLRNTLNLIPRGSHPTQRRPAYLPTHLPCTHLPTLADIPTPP